jgi:hypothetical protein
LVRLNSLVSNARGNQTTLAAEVTP